LERITAKVLVVDDDSAVASAIQRALSASGYSAVTVGTGDEAVTALKRFRPHLVILDLVLPDMSGDQVLEVLRARDKLARVLVLSALNDAVRKVALLRRGADDYMTKPYDVAELLARVDILMERYRIMSQILIVVGPIELDILNAIVQVGSQTRHLTPSQCKLLTMLLERHPDGVTGSEIRSKLHPYGHVMSHGSCKVLISSLRKVLGEILSPAPRIEWQRNKGWSVKVGCAVV
jgi:DNA-binding response OmpR family regulator